MKVSQLFSRQFILFLFVGLLNTGFGYGLFALLIFFKVHYALASLVSTILGIIFNFKTTGVIVFKNHNNILIFRFFMAYGITYLVGLGFLYVTNSFTINNYIAGAVWLLPGAIISYFLQKSIVFQVKESK
ncbi:MAG: GtrA family protein [Bacteroidota bacterium]